MRRSIFSPEIKVHHSSVVRSQAWNQVNLNIYSSLERNYVLMSTEHSEPLKI